MTPCEKLGYKVGDRFEVVAQNGSEAQVGWVVVLSEDDGTSFPYFKRDNDHSTDWYCPRLTEIRPLKPKTEAEKRGAKFGTMGVIKATGERVVFAKEQIDYGMEKWYFLPKSSHMISSTLPSVIRLDHEPEYKEIPFSEATDEQRMDVGNLTHRDSGRKITQIVMFDNGTYGFTISGMCSVFMDTYNITVRVPV
ncbi:MAG: hypothetical protein [Bacteriophage sp.]|nr:MAG: hypothetical protein [Bacteriophage sp.]